MTRPSGQKERRAQEGALLKPALLRIGRDSVSFAGNRAAQQGRTVSGSFAVGGYVSNASCLFWILAPCDQHIHPPRPALNGSQTDYSDRRFGFGATGRTEALDSTELGRLFGVLSHANARTIQKSNYTAGCNADQISHPVPPVAVAVHERLRDFVCRTDGGDAQQNDDL